MPKGVKSIMQLFSMKYKINLPFIELKNEEVMDVFNTVSTAKYHCYIYPYEDNFLVYKRKNITWKRQY